MPRRQRRRRLKRTEWGTYEGDAAEQRNGRGAILARAAFRLRRRRAFAPEARQPQSIRREGSAASRQAHRRDAGAGAGNR